MKKITIVSFIAFVACLFGLRNTSVFAKNYDATNKIVTIAEKADDSVQPNILYGRGMVTNHTTNEFNGRMYETFENYVSGVPYFKIYESTDHGNSWNHISNVKDQVNGWGLRYQPFLYELPETLGDLPKGTLICAGNSIPKDLSKTKIDLYKSLDHGRTWDYLSTIDEGGKAVPDQIDATPVWEPFLAMIDHQLVCYYSDERDPAHSQKLIHKVSKNGIDWGNQVEDVVFSAKKARPGMATVAKMKNGKYIMTYEVVGNGAHYSNYKLSEDAIHWNPEDEGIKFADGGSPYVTVLADGTIVANTANSPLYLNKNNGEGKWETLQIPMPGAYSRSLTALPNNQLLIVSGGSYAHPTEHVDNIATSMVFTIPKNNAFQLTNNFIIK
ncbi:hypothetical protein MEPL4_7c00210 [Melissococcus plutonius]|uniref:exo-alpha-sialidase n=1 Tax=Melissococcus plutonius TaxID=33970 RepID=UPI00065E3F44|nr:exo-alpha-sialidase [Melissococcus plutonius]AIM26077.1 hypothetical protein MEPL_178p000130 [Melissococcus plutonius S1]KMT23411.1 hypothetical protein MEPL1_15c00220 [Melissococcus plutonius]KMT23561.1 hypothetical protein MEPL2_5c00730 [Melissococcus plutonius]KMT28075.1 hypothetical protein MEPL4_7c00210 [Melissococcus plutonius]KMT29831.1 hypothetical protein MEPL7_7c00040 [Melissococcus plutonius]